MSEPFSVEFSARTQMVTITGCIDGTKEVLARIENVLKRAKVVNKKQVTVSCEGASATPAGAHSWALLVRRHVDLSAVRFLGEESRRSLLARYVSVYEWHRFLRLN